MGGNPHDVGAAAASPPAPLAHRVAPPRPPQSFARAMADMEVEDEIQKSRMIAAIEKENAEMEEEIARLTAKPEVPKAAPSGPITDASGAGIKVMIFKETKFNLLMQQTKLLATEGVELSFTADAVTEIGDGCVDPGAVMDLLEDPPPGVYRLKGTVAIRYRSTTRAYAVNVVGPSIHLAAAPPRARANSLVAIGMHLDVDAVATRLRDALLPVEGAPPAEGIRRLQRYRRLSI